MEYDFQMLNDTAYVLFYTTKDGLFEQIKSYKGTKQETDNLKKKLPKYDEVTTLTHIHDLRKNGTFPVSISGNGITTTGNVSPYNKFGYMIINFEKSIYRTEPFQINIGYGTLIATFSSGESSIYGTLGFSYALQRNYSKYFAVPLLATISNATINITGFERNYSVYKEFDYFTNGLKPGLWDNIYLGATTDCTSSYTASGQLTLVSQCLGGPGVESVSGYISANDTINYPIANLTGNKSLFLHFRHNTYCDAPCYNAGATARIWLMNKTGTAIQLYNEGSQCNSGSDTDTATVYVKMIFNDSTNNVSYYDVNNNPLLFDGAYQTNLNSLGAGEKVLAFAAYANKYGDYAPCGATSYVQFYIYDIGYNNNITEYSAYAAQATLPANFTLLIGSATAYKNTTLINETAKIDLTSALNTAMNNAQCNCTGCYISSNNCYMPITFLSQDGGGFNASAINLNYVYDYNITLIDEIDNTVFNVSNLSIVRVYWDNNQSYYDFKAAGNVTSYAFQAGIGTKLRFEFGDYGTSKITRYIDVSLINDTPIRICVNKNDVTHYEQLMTSNVQRKAVLKSIYADCYVAADYTRFAYENLQTLRAYSTDRPYDLRTDISGVETSIAGIDGGIASEINLDTLEFALTDYSVNIIQPTLSFQKSSTLSNTIIIRYLNRREDSNTLKITITNLNDSTTAYSSSSFTNPNNVTIYFDYSAQNYDNNTLFKIVAISNEGTDTENTITRYFTTSLRVGIFNPKFVFIISLLFSMFGLTITIARYTLGWVGLFIEAANIAFLSMGITTWYVTIAIGAHAIICVFIIITMVKSNYKTLVT